MYMSEREIEGRFRRAEDKRGQISILAQLNACDESEIREILLRNGVGLGPELFPEEPKKRGRKPGKKTTPKKEEKEVTPEIGEKIEIKVLEQKPAKEEVKQTNGMPEAVRIALLERKIVLTNKINELEKERDTIQDYLNGVVCVG